MWFVNQGCYAARVYSVFFLYEVAERGGFERAYGMDGEWARFFRDADGYFGTELLISEADHLVVDRWQSREAYEAFLAAHRDEYERLAAETAPLYAREERIGGFDSTAPVAEGSWLALRVVPGRFSICRLDAAAPPPADFWSITRTEHELSVICTEGSEPDGADIEAGWRGLQVAGPLDFKQTGVAASLGAPLAAAGIPLLLVATYDTDYVFVRAEALDVAVEALRAVGHTVSTES